MPARVACAGILLGQWRPDCNGDMHGFFLIEKSTGGWLTSPVSTLRSVLAGEHPPIQSAICAGSKLLAGARPTSIESF
uniref:Uncharacterized protein n=1 Tax=Setaria viridis TaxID=4556 RepID=A0A4U6TX73_SETVI|nr:hypothetical protein SEVIR_7G316450v2 [Setaria viridis]